MADAPHHATVTSRTTSPEEWDAGVHADSDAGPIDIGLSVEPTALGVVVEAPGVGLLKVAFDVTGDGTTKLARASRRLADGRDVPLVAVDEGERLRLEGELARLREQAAATQRDLEILSAATAGERDEARARAAELETALQAAEAQLAELRSRAVAEAADARANASTLEEQLVDTGARVAQLEAALAEARALAAAAQGRLQKAEVELTDATLRANALETDQDGKTALAQELADTRDALAAKAGLDEALAALRQELETARDALAEREVELTRSQEALAAATAERGALAARLAAAEAAPPPPEASAELTALTAQLEAVRGALLASETALSRRDESLALAVEQRDALQAQLAAVDDALALQQKATEEAREVARRLKAQADALLAERDEARAVARQLHQRLSSYRGSPTEPEMPAATREGTPTDPLLKKKGP
jgi:chromosome segregation ATPase